MTWDVPVKDDCPVCGHTMFKKSGKGFNKPFCVNPECPNFLPEDKRGYRRRKTEDAAAAPKAEDAAPAAAEPAAEEKKPATRKPAAKKTAAARKTTAKKATAAKTTGKENRRQKDHEEGGGINGTCNCDRRGSGRLRVRLAAGAAGHSRHACAR